MSPSTAKTLTPAFRPSGNQVTVDDPKAYTNPGIITLKQRSIVDTV